MTIGTKDGDFSPFYLAGEARGGGMVRLRFLGGLGDEEVAGSPFPVEP
jgi:hypothetical protein